ncbi:hypothetical protein HanRHA438_Chr06g0282421 [Helianthus annuus]|nr:hypothetical protein HanRHA438_Chr06g0282421 [Helianthus annuus]
MLVLHLCVTSAIVIINLIFSVVFAPTVEDLAIWLTHVALHLLRIKWYKTLPNSQQILHDLTIRLGLATIVGI